MREAAIDITACLSAEARGARPLFCGMSKAGRLSGTALSDKAVARLVKTAAAAAGLDPEHYCGHSLRAGLATAANDPGAGLADLMRQTRHKSTEVALGYLHPLTSGATTSPKGFSLDRPTRGTEKTRPTASRTFPRNEPPS